MLNFGFLEKNFAKSIAKLSIGQNRTIFTANLNKISSTRPPNEINPVRRVYNVAVRNYTCLKVKEECW